MSDAADNTAFDFSLDARQRSMLEAMNIKMWLPEPTAQATEQTARQAAQETQVQAHSSHESSQQNEPAAHTDTAVSAIETVASIARATIPMPASNAAPVAPESSRPRAPLPQGIAQMDWAALQTAVSNCHACALCESRKNTVFGVGAPPINATQAPQADWLIVGEAPGENEDLQGEPFVGQSGKLLDNMLASMKISKEIGNDGKGLSRKEGVYIANVITCRPPDNRNPSASEIATCAPYLARQIELLRPKIILAMGKFAISTVTGSNEPVGKLRGKVHTLNHPTFQAPVIVTYHPAYLLRNLPEKAKAWADLLLAMQTYSELPSQR